MCDCFLLSVTHLDYLERKNLSFAHTYWCVNVCLFAVCVNLLVNICLIVCADVFANVHLIVLVDVIVNVCLHVHVDVFAS